MQTHQFEQILAVEKKLIEVFKSASKMPLETLEKDLPQVMEVSQIISKLGFVTIEQDQVVFVGSQILSETHETMSCNVELSGDLKNDLKTVHEECCD